jgi:hypothetical protein
MTRRHFTKQMDVRVGGEFLCAWFGLMIGIIIRSSRISALVGEPHGEEDERATRV